MDSATVETPPTILRYEACPLPRANVVVEQPSKRIEAGGMDWTFVEAEHHAAQLNRWLAARPSPDRRYRMFTAVPEPTEDALLMMIDRLHQPEHDLDELWHGLRRRIRELLREGAAAALSYDQVAP